MPQLESLSEADPSKEPLIDEQAANSAPKESWLKRNWIPVACVVFALAGLALALYNFIKPCELATKTESSMDMMVLLDGSSSICAGRTSTPDAKCGLKLQHKFDFGNPGVNVQLHPDNYTQTWKGVATTKDPESTIITNAGDENTYTYYGQQYSLLLNVTVEGTVAGRPKIPEIRDSNAVQGPYAAQSNLLRSSFVCNAGPAGDVSGCTIKVTVSGLAKGAYYQMKTWHHDSNAAGASFTLKWNGKLQSSNGKAEMQESTSPTSPNPPLSYTAMFVKAKDDGTATLELEKVSNDVAPLNLNALEVFLDEFAVFELQKQAAVQFIKFIGDKDEGITDPEVGVVQFSGCKEGDRGARNEDGAPFSDADVGKTIQIEDGKVSIAVPNRGTAVYEFDTMVPVRKPLRWNTFPDKHLDGSATIESVEAEHGGKVKLADGTYFENPAYTKVYSTCNEPGFSTYDPDFTSTEVPLSKSISLVVDKTTQIELMEGGTDFGTPLVLCHNNIKTRATGTTADTKKFCVLISDGAPNEEIVSEPMKEFCREQNISTVEKCVDGEHIEKLYKKCLCDGALPPNVPQKKYQECVASPASVGAAISKKEIAACQEKYARPCCSSQTIQTRLKALGYMIMAMFVQSPNDKDQPYKIVQATEKLRSYGSCEKDGLLAMRSLENATTGETLLRPFSEPYYYEPGKLYKKEDNGTVTYSNYDKKIKAAVTTADVSPKDDKGIYRENDKKYVIIKDDTLKIGSKSSPLTRYVKWQDAIHSNTKNGYKYFPGDGQGDPPFITDVEPVIKGKVTLSDGTSFQNPAVDDCLFFTDATSTEDLIAKLPNIVKTLVEFTPKNESSVCIGSPLWLIFALACCGPLAIYMFWLPISILIAKALVRQRGPVKGRLRRKLAKKAYDIVSDVVQTGNVGDPQTQIFVQNNINDKLYTLDAHILQDSKDAKSGHAATVDELKQQLQKKSGIPPKEQRLVCKGTELLDGTKVTEYALENNSTVFLNPKPTKVRIKARMKNSTEPKVFELDADQSYNIDAVKQGMKELAGIPISGQQLWMNGKELLGNTALSDLPEGFELSLNPISGVFPLSLVSPNGETAPIEVKATHKMENVKKRLQKQGSLPDVDPNFLRMVFNGQEIGDRECCMDHDIPENAVIFVNPKKFRLPVRKPDGTTFELEVDPSYSVAKVQRGLQEACPDIPPDQFKLFTHGSTVMGGPCTSPLPITSMQAGKTLHELGINAENPSGPGGQPLLINPIIMKDSNGKTLPLTITPNMAVEDLKAKIEEITGTPVGEQTLIFEKHSITNGLQDGNPLSAYGVSTNGNVVLSLNPNRIKLTAKLPSGKNVPIDIDAAASIDDVKKKVSEGAGTPLDETQIYYNGKELKKGDLLDFDITDGGTLLVNPIMVHPESGRAFPVDVTFNDSVGVLEEKVREYETGHTEVKGSKLVYRGQTIGHADEGVDVGDKDKTLASYGMGDPLSLRMERPNGETAPIGVKRPDLAVYLEPKPIKLSIMPPAAGYDSGYTTPLTVDKTWTIDRIKQEMCQKTGIAVPEQKLMVVDGGITRELQMGTTLLENGIIEDMPLYLNPNDIRCFVKLPNGKAVVTTLNTADTPSMVRQKVEKITHIGSLEDTTLKYGIEQLDEGQCLAHYDIAADATIVMLKGGQKSGENKKWDVDAGGYFRGGGTADIKVDYGASGIAPPSSKIGSGEVTKLKTAAATVSLMAKMREMMADEEDEEDEEEQQARAEEAKARRLSAMRHAALADETDEASVEERAILESDMDMRTDDCAYKYTLCLMKCCPCLRPETEEEIEAKHKPIKKAETSAPTRPPQKGEGLLSQA